GWGRIRKDSWAISFVAGRQAAGSMTVAIAAAHLAGRRGLVMLEPDEACSQVRVLDVDGQTAGGRTFGASLDAAYDGDRCERHKGQHRRSEAAAFPKYFQQLAHEILHPACAR